MRTPIAAGIANPSPPIAGLRNPSGARAAIRACSSGLLVGAGADEQRAWDALVDVAERLDAPVWQEAFGSRAGFPQDHPRFAGHLPSDRARLRAVLEPFDAVLVVGAPAFRQYAFEPGPFHGPGTRVAVVTDDPDEAHRSAAELVVLAPVAPTCEALAARLAPRAHTSTGAGFERPPEPSVAATRSASTPREASARASSSQSLRSTTVQT